MGRYDIKSLQAYQEVRCAAKITDDNVALLLQEIATIVNPNQKVPHSKKLVFCEQWQCKTLPFDTQTVQSLKVGLQNWYLVAPSEIIDNFDWQPTRGVTLTLSRLKLGSQSKQHWQITAHFSRKFSPNNKQLHIAIFKVLCEKIIPGSYRERRRYLPSALPKEFAEVYLTHIRQTQPSAKLIDTYGNVIT